MLVNVGKYLDGASKVKLKVFEGISEVSGLAFGFEYGDYVHYGRQILTLPLHIENCTDSLTRSLSLSLSPPLSLSVCIYICIYIHIYVCVCVHACVICICIYI